MISQRLHGLYLGCDYDSFIVGIPMRVAAMGLESVANGALIYSCCGWASYTSQRGARADLSKPYVWA
jgi:hypothetical protein